MIDWQLLTSEDLDARHFDSLHKVKATEHRRARRERRELEKARKAARK